MKKAKDLLGINLRRLREKRDWTQANLAEKAELSVKMIQKLEYGQTNPSAKTLDTLSRALGEPVGALFAAQGGSITDLPDVSGALDFLSKFSSQSPLFQRMILALAYKDASYLRGVEIPPEARREIARLLGQLLSAGQK